MPSPTFQFRVVYSVHVVRSDKYFNYAPSIFAPIPVFLQKKLEYQAPR